MYKLLEFIIYRNLVKCVDLWCGGWDIFFMFNDFEDDIVDGRF